MREAIVQKRRRIYYTASHPADFSLVLEPRIDGLVAVPIDHRVGMT